ncbi:mCG140439, isoform CRA_b [Mus musculus]|nr:mCG140439, isoform CRA_b [Mus musculus]
MITKNNSNSGVESICYRECYRGQSWRSDTSPLEEPRRSCVDPRYWNKKRNFLQYFHSNLQMKV